MSRGEVGRRRPWPAPRGRGAPESPLLRVTWLGHSSVVLDLDGVRLVTDPLLQRHAGLLRRRGDRPDEVEWERSDAVLLSHLHHDHAELGSLRLLGQIPVLTAPSSARWLVERGLRGVGLRNTDWFRVEAGGTGALDEGPGHPPPHGSHGVRIRLCPAVHGHRPMPHRPNAANGHLIRGESTCIWVAGDTSVYPGMLHLPDLAGAPVEVALVPVGGWGPRLSEGHMSPITAARACAMVGARFAVPVHWGTLHAPASTRLPPGWMDRAGDAFAVALAREAPECVPVVLRPGQSWTATLRPAEP
ncbi:MBL fold metallo-hydrolase [Pengzhenrongella frigida]|uniref:MBL fold metallo-hydrolase n=1 Tax=Pengzhenrongella frigida TaxID=1259133 RepID=A0A4Q5N4W7_9MICO|nr:MBL fold metallo-hydrolase [Cellulomonas sp. HLT2-17]RYV52443.1 MBL fold metallo-hydrolase [Cellulomonas sp. HLT2-17]